MPAAEEPGRVPYRLGGMGYQDESGRRLHYGSYLHIPELLNLQAGLTEAHDELLFIIAHQAYELWFKELIHELVAVRAAIDRDDLHGARYYLRRVSVIEALLVEQVGVLETMAPRDFLAFRSELAPASGFQSTQFREIEFLSGLKDPGYLKTLQSLPDDQARLQRRLDEPSVRDAYAALLQRRSTTVLEVYRRPEEHVELFDLSEALLDHDEGFSLWRSRHIHMVERQIGDKPGTGGSTGVRYLQTTLTKRFFPELWQVRSQL
ncbi:MAG TPA: tryptophan 2,3-dioxygenase family protein [Candidatus Dormibacteraeota bacterium]